MRSDTVPLVLRAQFGWGRVVSSSQHSYHRVRQSDPRTIGVRRSDPQLFTLSSTGRPNATAVAAYVRGGLPPTVVRRLREHIDSNIDQRISVEALAKLANLSVCYFVRAFKQSLGGTPHYFLIRRRVERTVELLSGTDMPPSGNALAP